MITIEDTGLGIKKDDL